MFTHSEARVKSSQTASGEGNSLWRCWRWKSTMHKMLACSSVLIRLPPRFLQVQCINHVTKECVSFRLYHSPVNVQKSEYVSLTTKLLLLQKDDAGRENGGVPWQWMMLSGCHQAHTEYSVCTAGVVTCSVRVAFSAFCWHHTVGNVTKVRIYYNSRDLSSSELWLLSLADHRLATTLNPTIHDAQ